MDVTTANNNNNKGMSAEPIARKKVVEVHKHITGAHVPLNQPLFDLDGKIIPPYFDPRLLTALVQTEVSWWDKTHPGTKIGTDKSKKVKNETTWKNCWQK